MIDQKEEFFLNIKTDNLNLKLYNICTLNEFEYIPIVFICRDEDNNLYLCTCSEIRYKAIWIITKSSNDIITKAIKNEITLYEALKCGSYIVYVCYYGEDNYTCTDINFDDIDKLDLPDEDLMLDYLEYEDEDEEIFELLNKYK